MDIIFDLDLTLVDSSISEKYRSLRQWNQVYHLIPQFKIYEGFQEVFSYLKENDNKIVIITNSPGSYAQKVIEYFNIPCHLLIDYFSCNRQIKPKPNQFLKALDFLNVNPTDVISIGDKLIDYQASISANIPFFAATWDKNNEFTKVDHIPSIDNPLKLLTIIK